MNFNASIKGNLRECCIGCLNSVPNMQNLNEIVEKKMLFATLFNFEFSSYTEYPQFLCSTCETQLNIYCSFQRQVEKCLNLLEKYNQELQNAKRSDATKESFQVSGYSKEEPKNKLFTSKTRRKANERIVKNISKEITLEEVNQIVNDFKTKLSEKKTCTLCGFIAANRRAISSHMAVYHKDEKNSWCLECNHIFENYGEHKKIHNSKYKCPFCEKELSVSHYVEHLESHAGKFECELCNKKFKSASWLKKHVNIHTNDKPYSCANCSRSFLQLSSLRYHVDIHGRFYCVLCKKRYKSEGELTQHECITSNKIYLDEICIKDNENENSNEETILDKETDTIGTVDFQNYCKLCTKKVKSLSQHNKKYHSLIKSQKVMVKKQLQCTFCQKNFLDPYKLRVHIRTHTGELPYKCQYCDKRTINRTQLVDHERTHTKEKPYICNICGKAVSQSSSLRTHMKQHTGRPEVCELCNKRFCRKSELKLHLSKHMGEKPFLCTKCGKAFAQKSHLTEHMIGHSDERPFQCGICNKAFKKNILLKEHIKLHQGYKPFQCLHCPYACYKAYRLQQHMKLHSANS